MSQPNDYPTFNFPSEPYYGSEPSQQSFNASFAQTWNAPQGPRSVGHPAPSPSPSVRTARSAPNTRAVDHGVGFSNSQPTNFQNNRIDPTLRNLDHLTVPSSGSRFRTSPLDNANPIIRFYSDDAPWSTESRRDRNVSFDRTPFSPTNIYNSFRDGTGSDVGSIAAPRTDSGYHTIPHSLVSHDQDQDLGYGMTQQVGNISMSDPGDVFGGQRSMTDAASVISGRSATRSHGREITCSECKEVSKCNSDYKKHMLRHKKPFKCEVQGCRRGGRGFTTVNDLNRHKKSVHRIGATENSFQCASETCRHREKIWPRLDNFKQHIHRMHKDEDESDLIRRSAYRPPEPSPSDESMSVAPMDTTLAGIGTERQFSNPSNELDDPVSGISLTPDQDSHQWTFTPSMDDFSVAAEQPTTTLFSPQATRAAGSKPRHQSHSAASGATATTNGIARRESFRLDALAHVASSQSSNDKPTQRPPPTLSNAPQTKVDQQKALQKLSNFIVRDIQNAASHEPKDLENVIMRVLSSTFGRRDTSSEFSASQVSNPNSSQYDALDTDILTKKEALKATKEMTDLIKKAANPRPRRLSSATSAALKCSRCPVTVARACDMRKHMKRHTRPYGCTYPKCHKRFGAKSDWKRHENSQHFQLESFRCALPSPAQQTPCGELFYRSKAFESHLETHHKMLDAPQREHEVKTRRIGKNGQGQFWCGFCEKIVRLERKRNAAWDERFDHIDRHFNREGLGIEDWLCVEARKTKGEVLREMDKFCFDDEDTEGASAEDDGAGPQSPGSGESLSVSAAKARKRGADEDEMSRKRAKRELFRFCCRCQSGPYFTHTYMNCLDCDHQWCGNCNSAEEHFEEQQ